MKIRRSFFLCLALGFLLAAAIYGGLFFLQLGVPTKQWAWLHEIVETKLKIARAITKPKLLVIAGSSALYGISAEEIERATGVPAVNFGTNASLGTAMILHLTRQVCRPGDTVLLAFEYEQYLTGNLSGEASDEMLISYLLGHDPEYVRSLSFRMQFKLALLTPGDRLWSGLRAVFQTPKQDAASAEFIRTMLAEINAHGDQIGAVESKRPAQSATRSAVCFVPAYGFPPSLPGFPAIAEFCAWAKVNRVRVLATFPNICHRSEYDTPVAQQMPAQFRALYAPLGVPVLGDLAEAMIPEEQMFDTYYHPLRAAALERTRRLLVHLAPHLQKPPGDAR